MQHSIKDIRVSNPSALAGSISLSINPGYYQEWKSGSCFPTLLWLYPYFWGLSEGHLNTVHWFGHLSVFSAVLKYP